MDYSGKANMKKVLFIYTDFSSFVRQDYEILSSKFAVDQYRYILSKKLHIFIFQFIKQFIFLLFNAWRYDVFYIWFADYHALFPVVFAKLFRKKSFIVIGGYDAARIPSMKYGVFHTKTRGFFAHQSIKNSSLNLAVSTYILRKLNGIAPKANHVLLYNCVDFKECKSEGIKQDAILTVASVSNNRTFILKGMDTFIEVAKAMPQYNFQMIGISGKQLLDAFGYLPRNLEILSFVPHQKLIGFYQNAKIYCQLSRMDSFALTVAEAMYFNCFPVVTNEGGMPEVVGDIGYVVKRDVDLIVSKIEQAINNFDSASTNPEEWVKANFSMQQRQKKLMEIFKSFQIE